MESNYIKNLSNLSAWISIINDGMRSGNYKTIQKEIDKFVIRENHSWISKVRLYQRPEDGGLGAIHIETHANALRCAWAKRVTNGLLMNVFFISISNSCSINSCPIHILS